jgi:hypothetical protein
MRLLSVLLVLAAAPAAAETIYFQSPSGNIGCMISDGDWNGARCDILEYTPSFSKPYDCDLDYGHAFEVEGNYGSGYPVCAGDTVFVGGAAVLPYGQHVILGDIACYSETTGMECQNGRGGGFHIRRASQVVY